MKWPSPGSVGHAVSILSPSGTVEIGGTKYPARAEQWPIEVGAEVVVTGFNSSGLFVRKSEPSQVGTAKSQSIATKKRLRAGSAVWTAVAGRGRFRLMA